MEEIHRDDIDRLKRGDIFTINTVTQKEHQNMTPKEIRGIGARNQFNGPNWIDVTGDVEFSTRYRVKTYPQGS